MLYGYIKNLSWERISAEPKPDKEVIRKYE